MNRYRLTIIGHDGNDAHIHLQAESLTQAIVFAESVGCVVKCGRQYV
jgi:hypothetical protein